MKKLNILRIKSEFIGSVQGNEQWRHGVENRVFRRNKNLRAF